MPLPPSDMRGLLPPFLGADAATHARSPYPSTMSELASGLGTTPHREALLKNLITYRQMLATEGYTTGIQFVDGSFVENVEINASRPPSDIDVFSILSVPPKYLAAPPTWASTGLPFWQSEIAGPTAQVKNKLRFSLDTYAVLFEEMGPGDLIQNTIYWYSLFSHQKSTQAWKGFVALQLDPVADQAALSLLGSP